MFFERVLAFSKFVTFTNDMDNKTWNWFKKEKAYAFIYMHMNYFGAIIILFSDEEADVAFFSRIFFNWIATFRLPYKLEYETVL